MELVKISRDLGLLGGQQSTREPVAFSTNVTCYNDRYKPTLDGDLNSISECRNTVFYLHLEPFDANTRISLCSAYMS